MSLWLLALAGCNAPIDMDPAAEPPWPDWAFHHWVWEDESTQDSVMALVDGYLDRDIGVGAVIIDSPWATGYNTFEWDTARFPDPQGMIDALHDRGVRVFLWVVPAINVDVQPLYAQAEAAGYFMRRSAAGQVAVVPWWKGDGSLIDYWNPEAVAWWHGLVDGALAYDIDGWKCDGLDFSAPLAPYSPGLGRDVTRTEYSHAYYADFFDYTRDQLGDDRMITARPVDNYGTGFGGEGVAFAPIDINWAGWVGDQDPDFGGIRAALDNMYHSSLLGYVAFGSDIGGYREDGSALGRDKNAFVRWAQLGALNPVMENGGAGEHRPWLFDAETEQIYREFTALHHALVPYLDRHGAEAFVAGSSLMTFSSRDDYSYLLGPDLFVTPVLDDVTQVDVTFPDGSWAYLFDRSRVYQGNTTATVDVPLAEFPVFVRVGSEAAATLP